MCCWVGDFHMFIQQHIMGCLTEICERWVSSHEDTEWEKAHKEYGFFFLIPVKELAVCLQKSHSVLSFPLGQYW